MEQTADSSVSTRRTEAEEVRRDSITMLGVVPCDRSGDAAVVALREDVRDNQHTSVGESFSQKPPSEFQKAIAVARYHNAALFGGKCQLIEVWGPLSVRLFGAENV